MSNICNSFNNFFFYKYSYYLCFNTCIYIIELVLNVKVIGYFFIIFAVCNRALEIMVTREKN